MTAVLEMEGERGAAGRIPPSKSCGWEEEKYQEHLTVRERTWWPWWVAIEYYWRKTGVVTTRTQLFERSKKGCFKCCTDANAPSKLAPIDRDSFEKWMRGDNGKKKQP